VIVAIYNVWDGLELLRASVDNIKKCVDHVIIVFSVNSNHGEINEFPIDDYQDCLLVNFEPNPAYRPARNETAKRNAGLQYAKQIKADFFIMMDADEFYQPEEFKEAMMLMDYPAVKGIVCKSKVYFKSPTLTIGEDTTYVTAIHRLTPNLQYVYNYQAYPFVTHKGILRIDPTRRPNVDEGIMLSQRLVMHHYSWCRKDIMQKIRNSTAPSLRDRKDLILEDLELAAPGRMCATYNKELYPAIDHFNLSGLF
jgi:glycosyltransferase involved in cell wall biosynthesis